MSHSVVGKQRSGVKGSKVNYVHPGHDVTLKEVLAGSTVVDRLQSMQPNKLCLYHLGLDYVGLDFRL